MKQWHDYTGEDVTIVVCAYKECQYLENCIRSLKKQTVKTHIIISTSTPNEFIFQLAKKYQLEVHINPEGGHVNDYNFALKQVKTKLGIMAHQDDLLQKQFVEKSLQALNRAKRPIIAFTNYKEIHGEKLDKKDSAMVKIKRIMLLPLCNSYLRGSKFGKWIFQCLGDPITHPTVTYVLKEMPKECFRKEYQAAMDWDLWQRLSKQKGEFVYIKDIVFYHRIHKEQATAILVEETSERGKEEYEIFCRFWPPFLVKLIMKFYSKAEKFYKEK